MDLSSVANSDNGDDKPAVLDLVDDGINCRHLACHANCLRQDRSEELKILYRWRNGIKREFATDLIGRLELFSGGIPMDIEKVWWIQDTMGGNDIGWSRTKLPIFESGGGDFYLLNCDSTVPVYGQIIYYSPSAVDFELTISIYDSLFTLFQTTYEAYKKGIYSVDDEAMPQVDHSRLGKLADELNPISGYWKLYR